MESSIRIRTNWNHLRQSKLLFQKGFIQKRWKIKTLFTNKVLMHLNYCIIFSWRLFKLLCNNFQNMIHQTIPHCHCPFHLHFPYWLYRLLLHIHEKNISLGRCWRHSFTFSSRFSWSNLENFNFMDALYIWFLKSDIFGKYLRDVVGGNSWFRNNSIFTNMRICLCISLTCFTPSPTSWWIFKTILLSICWDIPAS